MRTEDIIPIMGLKAFQFTPEEDHNFLYFELMGQRSIEKPHKHDFFLFLLFEKGNGTHTIDFIDHEISDYQLHLLFPGQVHKWEFATTTKAYQLMMSRSFFETFANSLRFSLVLYQSRPVIQLTAVQFEQLHYEFQAIAQELYLKPISWDMLQARCRIIAQLTSRAAEQLFENLTIYRTKPLLFKYLSLVNQHFAAQKSILFYAAQLNITPNYLNILCKRHFNVSAMHLIQDRTILEAKRLIQVSGLSIKEIAFQLGFNDPAYFSNFFKAQTGISPSQFKTQL